LPRGRLAAPGLAWTGLAWTSLDWPGLAWTGLAWTGLARTGLAWPGLAWTDLDWVGHVWHCCHVDMVGMLNMVDTFNMGDIRAGLAPLDIVSSQAELWQIFIW